GTTMQSEEIGESASPLEVPSSKSEMTYSDSVTNSSSPKNNSQNEDSIKNCQQGDGQSESDIKMIPDSPRSPENGEENFKADPNERQIPILMEDRHVESEKKPSPQEQQSNESIRNWLQRITQMQTEIQRKLSNEQPSSPNLAFSEFPMKSSVSTTTSVAQNSTGSRVVKYQDLPYMGEMTLDNSKPRRGRKPKKADICHLIYKNYGTIYPGTPNPKSLVDRETPHKKNIDASKYRESPVPESFNRSDVQNRIISSLLEKRLTQESRRQRETLMSSPISGRATQSSASETDQNEPLNLCIRDLNQLKIRLLRTHDNVYSSENNVEVKSEPQSDDDVEFIHETPSPSSTSSKELKFPTLIPELSPGMLSPGDNTKSTENSSVPGGYVYWPNAGVFIHPMALQQHLMYYQKMAANNNYTLPNSSNRIPTETNSTSPEATTTELRKLAPKIKPKKPENAEEVESLSIEQKAKRNASGSSDKTPTKRKRSAIFIPPIPSESQTNPATEVSICKFKFTGGAKPSLQEKKMLSVDSGGNFRYYNGTGDKSMRGYEFFPRETLQQQISVQGSSTGAFLQASGEKIFPINPADFTGKIPHDFLLAPELQPQSSPATPDASVRHKKRKSRKSLQREKLEQTFKEKGFLIQTQQLESAEGATYCKFRQLRKFTRYLFRSWKDYLPEITNEEERARDNDDIENEADIENLSTLSNSDLTSSDIRE
ncbi:hypothetical protein Trydic_g21999, partial [Trypoxylus dichotomus]